MIFESHAHYDDRKFNADRDDVCFCKWGTIRKGLT